MSSEMRINPSSTPNRDSTHKKVRKDNPEKNFQDIVGEVEEKMTNEQIDERKYRNDELDDETSDVKKGTLFTMQNTAQNQVIPQNVSSVFDLARGKGDDASKDEDENSSKETLIASVSTSLSRFKDAEASERKTDFRYLPEQPDLASMNPMWIATQQAVALANTEQTNTTPVQKTMQEIIEQITKEIYSMEVAGQKDTVVKLNSDVFKDVRIVLSEFDSAKGQINIAFTNLTQAAERMIQMNKGALIDALRNDNIVVQQFQTSTVETNRTSVETDPNLTKDDREEKGKGKQQQSNP